jgi:hypothetical protein
MPQYDPSPEIITMSFEELKFIAGWIREQGETADNPITILIGGWAVDAYNSSYGSVDIDLVTNSRTKNTLKQVLKQERGYESYRVPGGINTVSKPTGDREIKEIIIDFILRERMRFEGRDLYLDFDIQNEYTEVREIRGGISAVVPKRSMLIILKLKASWDRSYRLYSETSIDPEWERGKLIKDYADIIALLDPMHMHGGAELDFIFLGEKLTDFDFLRGCLRIIPENLDAIGKYGRMDQRAVRETIERLLQLTE